MAAHPPVFTLSLDVELAWGEFYRGPVGVERLLEARRRFPELLALLERHGIRATLAFVGHLLLEGCAGHPELEVVRVRWREGEWLQGDPRSDFRRDPLWYAPDLFVRAASAEPGHDLGAHGFTHLPFGEPEVGAAAAGAELAACVRAGAERGVRPHSFVFPRNAIRFTELLSSHGFTCYRGRDVRWYSGAPQALRKTAHMLDQALAFTPRVGRPRLREGVIEAPSSMLFLSREGFRRHIPVASRVRRALRGIERAVREAAHFHLWLHAEDLVPEPEAMLGGLGRVLGEVRRRVERGELQVRTMAELAAA